MAKNEILKNFKVSEGYGRHLLQNFHFQILWLFLHKKSRIKSKQNFTLEVNQINTEFFLICDIFIKLSFSNCLKNALLMAPHKFMKLSFTHPPTVHRANYYRSGDLTLSQLVFITIPRIITSIFYTKRECGLKKSNLERCEMKN